MRESEHEITRAAVVLAGHGGLELRAGGGLHIDIYPPSALVSGYMAGPILPCVLSANMRK